MPTAIQIDASRAIASLNDLQRTQLPFAMSRTLNDIAFTSWKVLVNLMPTRFHFRTGTNWIKAGGAYGSRGWFRVTRSSKTNPIAYIDAMIDYLYFHEFGGIKEARKGRLAVPLGKLRTQRVPPQLRPKYIMGRDLQSALKSASLAGLSGKERPRTRKLQFSQFGQGFLLRSGGKEFIARHVSSTSQAAGVPIGSGRRTIDLMYVLMKEVTIRQRMRMIPTIRGVVQRDFRQAFALRLAEAMATRRA